MSTYEHTFAVVGQMEFYFSAYNLPDDFHLQNLMDQEGWVYLTDVCYWPRMALLGATDPHQVARAINAYSANLEVDQTFQMVRIKAHAPMQMPPPHMQPTFLPHAYPVMPPPHQQQVPHPHMFQQAQPQHYVQHPDQVGAMFVPQCAIPPPPMMMQGYPMGPTCQPLYPHPTEPQLAGTYPPQMPMHAEQMHMGMPQPVMQPMPQPQQLMQANPQPIQQPMQLPVAYVEEQHVGYQEVKPHPEAEEQGFAAPMEKPAMVPMAAEVGTESSDPKSSEGLEEEERAQVEEARPAQVEVPHPVQPAGYGEAGPVQVAQMQMYGLPAPAFPPAMGVGHPMAQQFPHGMPQPMPEAVGHAGAQMVNAHMPHQPPYAGEAAFGGQIPPQMMLVAAPSQVSTNGSESNMADCAGERQQMPAGNGCRRGRKTGYRESEEMPIERVASEVSSDENEALQHRSNRRGGAGPRGSSPYPRPKRDTGRRGGEGPSDKGPREVRHGAGWKKPYARFARSGGNDGGSNGGKRKPFHRLPNKDRQHNVGRRGQEERAEARRERPALHALNFPPLPKANGSAPGGRPQPKAVKEPGVAVGPAGVKWANKPVSVLTLPAPPRPSRVRHRAQTKVKETPASVPTS